MQDEHVGCIPWEIVPPCTSKRPEHFATSMATWYPYPQNRGHETKARKTWRKHDKKRLLAEYAQRMNIPVETYKAQLACARAATNALVSAPQGKTVMQPNRVTLSIASWRTCKSAERAEGCDRDNGKATLSVLPTVLVNQSK